MVQSYVENWYGGGRKANEEESWRLIDGIVVVNQRNDNNKRYTKSMENGDRGRKDRRENDTLLDGI